MKKKILLFIKTPPPYTGAALMNYNVLKSKLLKESFFLRTIEIHYVRHVSKLGKFSFNKITKLLWIKFRLLFELLFHRPKIVYFQITPFGIGFIRDFFFAIIIKTFRVKILYHLHGKGINDVSKRSVLYRFLYKHTFKNNYIICLSELLKSDISNVYSGEPYIVPNAIETRTFDQQYTKDNTLPNILFLSNLFYSKGVIDFIEALYILHVKGINFNAKIAGAEGDITKNDIENILDSKQLVDNVSYLGPIYGDNKYEILQKTDILVFPSKEDVWGLVILEAMQYSIPVIATIEGAIPEIVDDGKTGYLVEKSNPQQIAEKLEYLIQNEELRKDMGKAGREKYLKNYTMDIFEKNMLNVFNSVFKEMNIN